MSDPSRGVCPWAYWTLYINQAYLYMYRCMRITMIQSIPTGNPTGLLGCVRGRNKRDEESKHTSARAFVLPAWIQGLVDRVATGRLALPRLYCTALGPKYTDENAFH